MEALLQVLRRRMTQADHDHQYRPNPPSRPEEVAKRDQIEFRHKKSHPNVTTYGVRGDALYFSQVLMGKTKTVPAERENDKAGFLRAQHDDVGLWLPCA